MDHVVTRPFGLLGSSHPGHTIKGIPIGQFLRTRRICDRDEDFEQQAMDLQQRFLKRGYKPHHISRGYTRAKLSNRRELLQPKMKSERDNEVRLITNYHTRWGEVTGILHKYWPLLQQDQELKKILPMRPQITARRSPTIKDMLVKSHYVTPRSDFIFSSAGPRWGSKPCGHCSACNQITRTEVFHSSDGSKEYRIVHHINCRSTAVVYYAVCPCGLIYVGLTSRELKIRIMEHNRDIKAAQKVEISDVEGMRRLKPVARHFRVMHPGQYHLLKFRGIDAVHLGSRGGDVRKRLAQGLCRIFEKLEVWLTRVTLILWKDYTHGRRVKWVMLK
ncbi:uncharacterized protein [Dendropsophus ebraccatus]|uniref:uncharacterized protein n=1 Tax=Dendropsophus ebraccatus TaxID=150705 RepID=UPI0038321FC9